MSKNWIWTWMSWLRRTNSTWSSKLRTYRRTLDTTRQTRRPMCSKTLKTMSKTRTIKYQDMMSSSSSNSSSNSLALHSRLSSRRVTRPEVHRSIRVRSWISIRLLLGKWLTAACSLVSSRNRIRLRRDPACPARRIMPSILWQVRLDCRRWRVLKS